METVKNVSVHQGNLAVAAANKKHVVPVPSLDRLLTYRRPHNSEGEKQYIIDFIMPLKPHIITDKNEPMAFIVYVGNSDIMFTSHTDTVHNRQVPDVFQKVEFKNGVWSKNDKQPLGADDAAGNWLMFNMIHAGVPGIYAFFRGEERGGIGSTYCAKTQFQLFDGVKAAIAFDRRGTQSIITHQGAGRGCSDEFANSLADILKMGHRCDDTGIYTDTAEFFDFVPNCTNVSVGYEDEHSPKETLRKGYIEALRNALIAADWSKLNHTPPKPDPIIKTSKSQGPLFDSPFKDTKMTTSVFVMNPTDIADILFDYGKCLNHELHMEALALAQKIYKRYE
jgi:hypothetical protein